MPTIGPMMSSSAALSSSTGRGGASLTLVSMGSAQLGLAASVRYLHGLSPEGAAWIRLVWAGLLMLVWARPWRQRYTPATLRAGLLLGIAAAGMSTTFMAAASRLPLGTVSALEFLGPLAVAALGARGRRGWVWPLLAAIGVALLTQPWSGGFDRVGVGIALLGAVFYAGYIYLTQRLGHEVEGVRGLGLSMPVAAMAATLFVGPTAMANMTFELALVGLLLALLVPLVPFVLEMLALRRLSTATFATLLCLEPAIGLLLGLLLLGQIPDLLGLVGLVCVIRAGVGAVRAGQAAQPVCATA